MATQPLRKEKSQYQIFVIVILTAGFLLLPLMFGSKITISPFVLFLVAILPNIFWFRFGKTDSEGKSAASFKVFLLHTFASAAAALLIVIIYRVAYSIGS